MSRRQPPFYRAAVWFLVVISFCRFASGRTTVMSDPYYLLDRWETTDGLPENSATAIVQSQDGYLWFGTFNGLVRFDGVRCVVFDPTTTPELPNAEVVNLFMDREEGLWVSTTAGLARLHHGKWKRLTPAVGWAGNFVRTFAERQNGEMLLTTFDGHVLEFRGGQFLELKKPPGEAGEGYFGFVDGDQKWWLAQNKFVGSWDGKDWVKRMEILALEPEDFGAGPARGAGFWILMGTELARFVDGVEKERRHLQEKAGSFWSLFEDGHQNVWISTFDKGMARVSADGSLKRWTTENGLMQNNARMAMEDTEENIWMGTSGSGLVRLKAKRFYTFGKEAGLAEENVKTITQGKGGELLLGTYGSGLFSLDQRGMVKVASPQDNPNEKLYLHSLLADGGGAVWVGAMGQGLSRMSGGESKIFSKQHTGPTVWALFEDSKKRVWAAGDEGVVAFEGDGMSVFDEESGLRGRKFRCFAEQDGVWTASSEGVFRLAGEKFEEVGKSIREVTCLLPDGNGGMWMGTTSSGLAHWDKEGLRFVGGKERLPVRSVLGMVEDGLGFFWLASNRGIVRVNKLELTELMAGRAREANFILLGMGEGLPTLECSGGQQPNCARDREGRLWFATLRGVAMIDPKSFRINPEPPKLYIEEVTYRDRNGKRQQAVAKAGEMVRMPAGSTRFEARLAGLSFRAPEEVIYSFRLNQGSRLGSLEHQSGNVLTKERLSHGEYLLLVGARNADGIKTAKDVSLAFVVEPFYWETAWFRLGGALAAILTVGGGTWGWTRFRWRRQVEDLKHHQAVAVLQTRLAAVLQSTSDFVGFATPAGKVIFINDAGRQMLGIPEDEDMSDFSVARFHERESFREGTLEGLRKAQENGSWAGENQFLTRDGRRILVSQVIMAHRQLDGKIEFFSTVARDISDRVQAERALRESEERYRTLIESLPVGIVVAIDERIVFANRALLELRARTLEEVLGTSIYDIVPPEYHERTRERRRELLATGKLSPAMELEVTRADGSVVHVESQAVRVIYDGRPAIINFVQDLTGRKIAEQQREQIGRELRELAAQMLRLQDEERRRIGRELHDSTGQSLAALEINLGMLSRRLSSAGGKEAQLIEECIALAGQCSGEIRTTSYLLHPPLLDEIGLSSALRWYVDGFTKRSNIAVKLTAPEALKRFSPEVELSLFRVVQESLTNIHRHSGSETAAIEFTVNDAEVALSIADEGKGIAEEKLRLFRMGHSNLGVGITGMRERIRQLGGELTVESSGSGAVVQVRLPNPMATKK